MRRLSALQNFKMSRFLAYPVYIYDTVDKAGSYVFVTSQLWVSLRADRRRPHSRHRYGRSQVQMT